MAEHKINFPLLNSLFDSLGPSAPEDGRYAFSFIDGHLFCEVGCEKVIAHTADELRDKLAALFDKHIRPWAEAVTKKAEEKPAVELGEVITGPPIPPTNI